MRMIWFFVAIACILPRAAITAFVPQAFLHSRVQRPNQRGLSSNCFRSTSQIDYCSDRKKKSSNCFQSRRRGCADLMMISLEQQHDWGLLLLPSVVSIIETFDGSQIVDPIIVSNVFWSSLLSRIISFLVAQLLAAAVFTFLVTLAAQQFTQLANWFVNRSPSQSTFSGISSPTPTPTSLLDGQPQPDLNKLVICLLIDIIGTSSEALPIIGELTDVAWAPVAGFVLQSLFGGSRLLFALEFAEEILPFTDFLPLATICWVVDTYLRDSRLAEILQLGRYAPLRRRD